jgi:hypothetical protein
VIVVIAETSDSTEPPAALIESVAEGIANAQITTLSVVRGFELREQLNVAILARFCCDRQNAAQAKACGTKRTTSHRPDGGKY